MKRKIISFKILATVLSLFILSSCSNSAMQSDSGSQATATGTSIESGKNSIKITSDMLTYDEEDYYAQWESKNPNYIKLNGASASLTGSGATIAGSKVTITAAGIYEISGKLDNGQIIVDIQDKGVVRLVLNGMEISSKDSAPIYVKNAGKTIISLQEGTENVITDGGKYVFSDASAEAEEPNSSLFSKDNLVINGKGTLTVNANYNNGISSNDDLKITGGKININSKDDGLLGKDMVLVKNGNITIKAGGDGIRATNDKDAAKGFIAIEGGKFNLTTGTDGLQAKTSMLIAGGDFNISTGGGSANSSTKSSNDKQWGEWDDNTIAASEETDTQSAKALKAGSDITISSGTLKVDSSDDAINSNNSINITGGDTTIASGDDGIHADSSIEIIDGKINITKSYEGIESMVITFNGGETHVVASDDGVNVNGGKDGSSTNGRPGQNDFAASENSILSINGGNIYVDSQGDGLDSNGNIKFTGGTVVVSGPTENNNAATDYNGTFEMNGGFLIAAGSSGMAEAPSEQSTQNSILMYYPNIQQASTLINLKDSKGNTLVTFAPEKEYQSVVISSPELMKDETYTLYSGGTSTGKVTDGLYTDGAYQGGTKVVAFTIKDIVTYLNESGITAKQSFGPGDGGRRGFGGRKVPNGDIQAPQDGEGR